MTHKQSASEFLKLAASGQVRIAYDRFIAPDFIHHNQYFKGDRASLLSAMQEAHGHSPNKSLTVEHIYEDGDTVITHSHVVRQTPGQPDIAVIHIFRFQGDKVVELWDVGQEINQDSPNDNGPF